MPPFLQGEVLSVDLLVTREGLMADIQPQTETEASLRPKLNLTAMSALVLGVEAFLTTKAQHRKNEAITAPSHQSRARIPVRHGHVSELYSTIVRDLRKAR